MSNAKQSMGYAARHRQKQSFTQRREIKHRFKLADNVPITRDDISLPEIPQRNYMTTMDRSNVRRTDHGNPHFYVPQYNGNVGNMVLGQLVLAHHPRFGSRYMVVDRKPVREIFETRSEPAYPKRPVWNSTKNSNYIYRSVDPSWHGKYKDEKFEFRSPDSTRTQNSRKLIVQETKRTVNSSFNKKSSDNANEKSEVQGQLPGTSKEDYVEQFPGTNSPKKKQPFSKYTGNRNNILSEPNDYDNDQHLPSLEQDNVNAPVPFELDTFENTAYVPKDGEAYSDSRLDSQRNVQNKSLRKSVLSTDHEPEVLTLRQSGASNNVTPRWGTKRFSKNASKRPWYNMF